MPAHGNEFERPAAGGVTIAAGTAIANPARPTRREFVVAASCATGATVLASAPGAPAFAAEPPAASGSDGSSGETPADQVVIYHTNDMHGHFVGDGTSTVGIDLVAGMRVATPNSLLVDAGDAMQGMPIVSLAKGASAVELMNAAGYDAMCVGNHDFDFGRETLLENAGAMEFPLLGANVLDEEGRLLFASVGASGDGTCNDGATAVLACGGRRIGVFGITTTETPTTTSPSNVAGLTFADEVETAEACIAKLVEQEVDAIVALCHLGNGSAPCHASDLAERLSPESAARLAAIVDGHSHTVENVVANGVLVVQTGCNLANLGRLTLTFGEDGTVSAAEEFINPAAAAELAEAEPAVSDTLSELAERQEALMAEVLFETPTTLWGGRVGYGPVAAPARAVETNLGDLVSDALRACAVLYLESAGDSAEGPAATLAEGLAAAPVVAVENGGGIREAIARGAVSKGSLATVFPFSNTVVLKQVTPAILRRVLELSLSLTAGQDADTGMLLQESVFGGFLQVAGVTVECDPNAEEGRRVTSMTLDGSGEPLDPTDDETPVILVSNNFIMTGGNGYDMLAGIDPLAEVGGELEAVQDYLTSLAAPVEGSDLPAIPLFAGTEGRIAMRGGYEPADWFAVLRAVDASGDPVPHAALTLEVDSTDRRDVESDENGLVCLALSDGPHAIAVVPENVSANDEDPSDATDAATAEAYVDNYLGFGLVEDDLRTYPSITVPA